MHFACVRVDLVDNYLNESALFGTWTKLSHLYVKKKLLRSVTRLFRDLPFAFVWQSLAKPYVRYVHLGEALRS